MTGVGGGLVWGPWAAGPEYNAAGYGCHDPSFSSILDYFPPLTLFCARKQGKRFPWNEYRVIIS